MNIPTQLFHYSDEPIQELRPGFYDEYPEQLRFSSKPIGLWFSVEDFGEHDQNWKTWCESEKFNLESLKYRYQVKLRKDCRILLMYSDDQLKDFSLKYAKNDLNWLHVMKEYDGIMIAPYNCNCRHNSIMSWYYGWDCSSGCIWNIQAIESFDLISVTELSQVEQDVRN